MDCFKKKSPNIRKSIIQNILIENRDIIDQLNCVTNRQNEFDTRICRLEKLFSRLSTSREPSKPTDEELSVIVIKFMSKSEDNIGFIPDRVEHQIYLNVLKMVKMLL